MDKRVGIKKAMGGLEMDLLDELRDLGVGVDKGLSSLNGKQALYEKLLVKFADMIRKSSISADFSDDECGAVMEEAHSIKGVSGNLAITPIYEAYSEIVASLRADRPDKAREALANILPTQEAIVKCIEEHK